MNEIYLNDNVNKGALNRFFENMKKAECDIHTIQIYKNNECVLRIAQEPYSCKDAREVYSLSKMFTSTVVGIASDMGLLSAGDKICDIFPEYSNDAFKDVTIRNVLSMNTGHSECVMPLMRLEEDSVAGFFSKEPKFTPGTHFAYNTGATCLLAAIVEKKSGMKFFDFACKYLFYPLGITDVYWGCCHDGICYGGVGLHISNDDIIKLGLMYYNKGIYNGKRILSEEWIAEATSKVSDNSDNGNPDWSVGYGYQIWMNEAEGYRGDGAFGQLCLVYPKQDIVVAVGAIVNDMQAEISGIYELACDLFGSADGEIQLGYEPYEADKNIKAFNKVYMLKENAQGFDSLNLSCDGDEMKLTFNDGKNMQKIVAGNGKWVKSAYRAKHMTPNLVALMTSEFEEEIRTAACFKKSDDGYIVCVRYLSNPHTEYFKIVFKGEEIKLEIIGDDKNRLLRIKEDCIIEGTDVR